MVLKGKYRRERQAQRWIKKQPELRLRLSTTSWQVKPGRFDATTERTTDLFYVRLKTLSTECEYGRVGPWQRGSFCPAP